MYICCNKLHINIIHNTNIQSEGDEKIQTPADRVLIYLIGEEQYWD